MSRTMLSSVNDAGANGRTRLIIGPPAERRARGGEDAIPEALQKYAPPVACAVAAAAVAVALFSSPPLPPPPPPPRPRLPYASDPTRPHSLWSRLVAAVLRDLPHRGPDGAARRGPPRQKKRWRRTRASPAIEGLRNSATYLRKARGRKAARPVHAQPLHGRIRPSCRPSAPSAPRSTPPRRRTSRAT